MIEFKPIETIRTVGERLVYMYVPLSCVNPALCSFLHTCVASVYVIRRPDTRCGINCCSSARLIHANWGFSSRKTADPLIRDEISTKRERGGGERGRRWEGGECCFMHRFLWHSAAICSQKVLNAVIATIVTTRNGNRKLLRACAWN